MNYPENKNFVNSNPNNTSSNQYTSFIGTLDFVIIDSFQISVMRTFTERFKIDGFLIEKRNLYSGKLIWSDVFNSFNGSTYYFSKNRTSYK